MKTPSNGSGATHGGNGSNGHRNGTYGTHGRPKGVTARNGSGSHGELAGSRNADDLSFEDHP